MDGRTWKKVVTDAGLLGKGYTQPDIDLTFTRVKSNKASKKIDYNEFLLALAEVATKQKVSKEDVMNKVAACHGPKASGTVADQVKFHDDKALYTVRPTGSSFSIPPHPE